MREMLGDMCADIDECVEYIQYGICDRNARCDNLPGNYTCSCRDGFHGDGLWCYGTYDSLCS